LSKDEYTYRRPRWFVGLFVVLGFATPLLCVVAVAVLEGSWPIGIGGGLLLVLLALLAARFWLKIFIVIDSEGIRWPLTGREVRWDDVESSRVVKILGFDYVRVTTKSGKVRWIALAEPGGRELRRQILARLGLSQ
jgi:hypothetical protein